MNNTKHDLSFDSTKLDFQALIRTAAIAYSGMRTQIENKLSQLQHLLNDADYLDAHFPLTAESLAQDANRLSIAAATYYTLLNAQHRSQISIVNKPEVKEVA